MAKHHQSSSSGSTLTPAEQTRALYLLTNAELPFAEFAQLPEVQSALRVSRERSAGAAGKKD
jgi:hypothetical protein